jgi:hypothetical protein
MSCASWVDIGCRSSVKPVKVIYFDSIFIKEVEVILKYYV